MTFQKAQNPKLIFLINSVFFGSRVTEEFDGRKTNLNNDIDKMSLLSKQSIRCPNNKATHADIGKQVQQVKRQVRM